MNVEEAIAALLKEPQKWRVAIAAPTEAVYVDFLAGITRASLQDPDEPDKPPQDVVVLWPVHRREDRTEKR